MKQKHIFGRIIAILMVIVMFASILPLETVYAAVGLNTIISDIISEVQDTIEEVEEAQSDQYSKVKAGNWWLVRDYDHLPWNIFHIAVQRDILQKYKDAPSIKKELPVTYIDENGEVKKGRADLYLVKKSSTYLWEVKPFSYSIEPKRSEGIKQLTNYVNAIDNKNKYKFGEKDIIDDGTTYLLLKSFKEDTEIVLYEVTYTVEDSGLILYKFTRRLLRKEKCEETEKAYEIMGYYATYEEAVQNAVESGYIPDSEEPEEGTVERPVISFPSYEHAINDIVNSGYIIDDDTNVKVDINKVLTYITIANAWGAFHDAINSNPQTANSLSAGISYECKKFVAGIIAYIGADGALKPETVYASEIKDLVDEFELAIEAYADEGLADELVKALEEEDTEKIEELLKGLQGESDEFDKAGQAQPPRDPLVIDLGEEGIKLCSINNGVNFDLDNNGFAEKTAWISNEDGFLAIDRNGNGKIDNGGELFGDQVTLRNGTKSVSGFEALTEFDENLDGLIDSADSDFEMLKVWVDTNHNGISESDEIHNLEDLGIISLSLEHRETSFVDEETGTRIAETADVEISRDGEIKTVDISEFWFPINSSDTTKGDKVTVSNVSDIMQAINDDESGELFELCYSFSQSEDIAEKRYFLKQILYFITDAKDIPVNSRGGNIDARDLKVIEQFMGREFAGIGGSNPNVNAAGILKGIYNDIENQYYNILNMYGSLGGYLKIACEIEDENNNKILNLSFLNYIINMKILNGEKVDSLIYDLGIYLKVYDKIHGTGYYDEYCGYYSFISSECRDIVELTKSGSTYLGTDGNDSYSGSNINDFIFGEDGNDKLNGGNGNNIIYGSTGNDIIIGGANNDRIYGNEGDDILDGGAGDDYIEGNEGNDTYIFTRGYGKDTIIDDDGNNIICFTNINVSDVLVNGTDRNDATIKIKDTSDSLVIKNFCESELLSDYTLEFKDMTMHCTDENSPFKHIYGSNGDDELKAVVDHSIMNAFGGNDTVTGSNGRDIIYGNSGNDTIKAGEDNDSIYGGADDDLIYGEDGDDIIFGDEGQDVIDGGTGNDFLFGGSGDDTYVFGKGYGIDIIDDYEGISTIRLSDSLAIRDLAIYKAGNEAIISIKDTEDILIISGYGNNSNQYILETENEKMNVRDLISDFANNRADNIKFMIGTNRADTIYAKELKNIITAGAQNDYIKGNNNDIIFGDGNNDRIFAGSGSTIIYGGDGNDRIYGNDGNDFIAGGIGNDYINAGSGDDIIICSGGNDSIYGSSGNDTYYFNAGAGRDSIADNEGNNVIIFGEGIFSNGIKAYRRNWNDLLITFEGLSDTLTIKNYCIDNEARNFKLIFADGSAYEITDKNGALRTIYDNPGTEYMYSIYDDGITLISTSGNDRLIGSEEADKLIGGNGNNRIVGNAGDDIIDGGRGKDYLDGGLGSDTYIYKKGYGTDTIRDSQGTNTIEISEYSISDVRAYRTNGNNITLVLDGSGENGLYHDSADKIVIEGFFKAEENRDYYLSFNGSKVHATAGNSPLRTIYGTGYSDYMQGFDNNPITMYGGESADTLNGGDSDDILYGGNGNDRILGNAGNDILSGEAGNDYLDGGDGNDTYIIETGTGTDTIHDNQGINVISFENGYDKDKLTAYRTGRNDLTITFSDMRDKVVIQDYYVSEDNRKFDITFADGNTYKYDDEENPINNVCKTYNDYYWMSVWMWNRNPLPGRPMYGEAANMYDFYINKPMMCSIFLY